MLQVLRLKKQARSRSAFKIPSEDLPAAGSLGDRFKAGRRAMILTIESENARACSWPRRIQSGSGRQVVLRRS
jgi:hypothetical protein